MNRRWRDRKWYHNITPKGIVRNVVKVAALGLAAVGVYAVLYATTNPLENHKPCDHTVQSGETIDGMCAGEGVPLNERQDCIDFVLGINRHYRVPGSTTPAFDLDVDGNGIPSTLRAGAVISIPDVDGDGKVLGQECRE